MTPSEQTAEPALQQQLNDAALAGEWILDPSLSTVSLKNRSMGGLARVRGVFRQVTGYGTVSPAGRVSGALTVAAASIDTKNARRDTHLRSADFFDSDNYPDITFTVEGIRPAGRGVSVIGIQPAGEGVSVTGKQPAGEGVTVTGTLRVRDRTRPLSFEAAAAIREDGEAWLDAEVSINRADFGLTWNLLGLVSMNNTLTVHAVFTKR